jgi:hypothetical protein
MKNIIFSPIAAALVLACSLMSCSSGTDVVPVDTATTTPPAEVTACASLTGIQKILCLANAFKSQLDASQLAAVQLAYNKTDAVKWSNFPQSLLSAANKRVGLNFGSMTATQISYAKALLKEVAGTTTNEGWQEIEQILNADNYLKTVNANGGYGSENYYIAFLGTPAATGTFEIQFGGHHLAFANTYKDGVLVGATPSFRGIEPTGVFTFNGTTNQPLDQELSALVAILNSFSATELATARLSPAVTDLVAGPQKDNSVPAAYAGVKCSNLTAAQKELVMKAIKTYVEDVADYTTFAATYESEINDTYISYSGNTSLSIRGDYIRIHGPSVWIEWAVQPPVALSQPHIHSVWRDRRKDYGGN